MQTLVEFKKVTKKFGDQILIDDVSFKLNKGEITTLIGQNGAGKTTIARMILGLEDHSKGQIKLQDGIRIGYVPQKLDFNFNMPITGEELIKILSPQTISQEIIDLANFVGYEKIKKKDISKLSGGQLQKLIIAGTLANNPDLVIFDEPTQFLDVVSQQEFYRMIMRLKEKTNISVFMISHDLFTVMKNSDYVICLNGHICCSGKPSEHDQNIDFNNALSEIGFYVHKHNHKH